VLSVLATVGYGHTLSYTDLAAAVGSPRAVRAVGSACATNPLPLLLPCHRVIRSDGSLGGYRGGHSAKQHLLALERPRHHGGTG
jgi:methylated-DNA-[protein]-cysteine S-methyltransferase